MRLRRPARVGGIGLTVLALLLLPRSVAGQGVTGVVSSNGVPVPYASIMAYDSTGTLRGAIVSSGDGRYRLQLPSAGSWRIEARYLGLEQRTVRVEVPASQFETLDFELAPDPVALPGLTALGSSECPRHPNHEEIPAVWGALRQLGLAGSGRSADFLVETSRVGYHRWKIQDLSSYADLREEYAPYAQTDSSWVEGAQPILTRSVERLLAEGFVQPLVPDTARTHLYDYHLPLPHVVLDEAFAASHCLRVRREGDRRGLHFALRSGSGIDFDVEVTFWLPTPTSPRPRIDFRHRPIPNESDLFETAPRLKGCLYETRLRDRVGGWITLGHAEGLGWIPAEWSVFWPTMGYGRPLRGIWEPLVRRQCRRGIPPSGERAKIADVWQLIDFKELRGRVLLVRTEGDAPPTGGRGR